MKLYQNICFAGSRTEAENLWQCHRCVISLSYSLFFLIKGLNLGHLEVNDLWDFFWGGEMNNTNITGFFGRDGMSKALVKANFPEILVVHPQ